MAFSSMVGSPRLRPRQIAMLLLGPLDSVRYFEFDFARECALQRPVRDLLDVSSPRLFPLLLLREQRDMSAVLLNPDRADLEQTLGLAAAAGLGARVRAIDAPIADVTLPVASFDVVSSLSVVEHIPEDTAALAAMWQLLRSGGCLVLTLPCTRQPYEEWADFNKYGVLGADDDGWVFWQRFYSPACLASRVYAVLGKPARVKIYGERRPGSYDRNVLAKMRSRYYPIWREPWMMAKDWRVFDSLDELPGIGVIGLMFVKE